MLAELLQDLVFALRTTRRNPSFALVAGLTLTIGLAAATAAFVVIDASLLRPLPYPEPETLVAIGITEPGQPGPVPMSGPAILGLPRKTSSFAAAAGATIRGSANLSGGSEPRRVAAAFVSPGFFDVLRVPVAHDPNAAVISDRLWRDAFGAGNVVGRAIRVNGLPRTIRAVLSPGMTLPQETDLWLPVEASSPLFAYEGVRRIFGIGRLRPGVSLDAAKTDAAKAGVAIVPLNEALRGTVRRPLLILGGGALFLLAVSWSNAFHLFAGRTASRQTELMVRAVLGASPARLGRQLLAEAALIVVAASAAGAMVADIARALDGRAVLFHAAATAVTLVLLALARRARMERSLLVGAVMALAVALSIGAGLLVASHLRLRAVDLGLPVDGLVTMKLDLPEMTYPAGGPRADVIAQIVDAVRGVPGVHSAAAIVGPPLGNRGRTEAQLPAAGGRAPRMVLVSETAHGYFATAGIRLLAGRELERDDRLAQRLIVNETAARRFWPGRPAVGQTLVVGTSRRRWEVAGVAADVRQHLDREIEPQLYVPLGSPFPPRELTLVVRTSMPPRELRIAAQRAAGTIVPDLPLYDARTMTETIAGALAPTRQRMVLFAILAAAALLLAATGVYASVSADVVRQRREIGLHIAAGATSAQIVRLVLRRVLRLTLLGIGAGIAAAMLLTHTLESLLYEIDSADPRVFAAAAVLLLAMTAGVTAIPAHRAATLHAARALRDEAKGGTS